MAIAGDDFKYPAQTFLGMLHCVQAVNLQIQQSVKQLRILAAVAPFAAVSGSADTLVIVTKAVASFIKVRREDCVCGRLCCSCGWPFPAGAGSYFLEAASCRRVAVSC
jgi:hypothetical protein